MSEEKKDFVVKDRRIFTEDNQDSKKSDDKESQEEKPQKEESQESVSEKPASAGDQKEEPQLPEINFPTFIFSLNSSALVQLGLLEDPALDRKTKNLPLAKQTIDILGMLEEKTRGNLTSEEENMLKNILYDLRMLYVREKE